MSNEERRILDPKIENIERLVQEIHQRQNEVTIPTINEIKNTLYSKGGLCEIIHEHTGSIKNLDERIAKIPIILGWIITGISVGAGSILWVIEHGKALMNGGSK